MSEIRYKFKPDWLHLVPPGETILESMENMSLSQVDLAKRTQYSTKHIHKLLTGEAPISADTALRLEKVLNMPAYFWTNLENTYRGALAKEAEKKSLAQQQGWLKNIPLNNMLKFGWVEKYADKGEQIIECLKFYGVSSVAAWREQQKDCYVAFKAYEKFSMNEAAIQTWLRAGENEAVKIVCQPFNKKELQDNLAELKALTLFDNPDDFLPPLKKICANCGIAIVFTPTPPKCPMGGATKWLSPHKALLMLGLLYKTNDHLWFVFFHEIGHILKHKKQLFLESTKSDFKVDINLESEADKFASDILIPPKYIKELSTLKTPAKIKRFATKIGIAPGLVVGRLQHKKIIAWSSCNELKVSYQWE